MAATDIRGRTLELRAAEPLLADVVLCPVSELNEDRDTPNTLAYEAAHNGIAIYGLSAISIDDRNEIERRAIEARNELFGAAWDVSKRNLSS